MNDKTRVLYVDDDPLDRALVRDALEREHGGFAVTEATSRSELEARLADGEFDVVLSDFNILGIDGLQVVAMVRAVSPEVPVLIVTGTGSEEVAVEAMKRGAADYVIKTPEHIRRLPLAIAAAVERSRLEGARREVERRHRDLFEGAPDAIFLADPDSGEIVDANPAAAELLGRPRDEVVGLHQSELHPPAMEEYARQTFNEHADEPGVGRPIETVVLRSDGTQVPVEVRARRVELGGKPLLQGCFRDISERTRAKEAIRAERDRAQRYLDIAGVILVAIGADGCVTLINRKGCSLLGYEEEQVVGRSWFEMCVPESDREATKAVFAQLMAGEMERAEYLENLVVTSSGEHRLVAWHNTILHDEHGVITGTLSSGEDITEERRAQRRLEEQERYFRSLMYGLHEDILVIDREFRITDVNNTALVTTGQTRDQAVGRFCYEVSHGYDAPCSEMGESCALAEVFTTGEARSCHHVHRGADGSEVHVNIVLSPLADAEGRVTHVVEAARDVTGLVEADAELKVSEERYRRLVESMTEGMGVLDENGVLTFVNEAFRSMVGHPREELVGRPLTEFLDDASTKILRTQLAGRPVGEDNPYELAFTHRDGHHVYTIVSPRALFDGDGLLVGSFAVVTDITERRQLEEQLAQAQKLEAIGQLAGGIAHDFNNLLMAMSGSAELLGMQAPDLAEGSQDLATIRDTVQRGAQLTRRLLAIARQQVLHTEILDLDRVVADELGILRRVIPESIDIDFRPAGDLPAVRADRGQLAQVLMNLVVNARDALADGGAITLETQEVILEDDALAARPGAKEGVYVRLSVEDTGEGMDDETLARVFDPFFSTKDPERGTGLGLATVYGIVRQHGGVIEVRSAPGEGARFEVYLPAVAEAAEENGDAGEIQVVGGGETVLVVEDDEIVRRAVVRILGGLGYAVLEAGDGEEGLALIAGGAAVDLVLSDVVMPRMGGEELLDRARLVVPRLRFLFSSGYADEGLRDTLQATEGTFFIAKPFTTAKLGRAVREALGNTE